MGPPHTCGSGRFEELSNLIRTIRNAMKIRDVTRCLEEFELLGRAYAKARGVLDKEGVPRFYVRLLADLEDYLNEVWGGMWGWVWGRGWGEMGGDGMKGNTELLWVGGRTAQSFRAQPGGLGSAGNAPGPPQPKWCAGF